LVEVDPLVLGGLIGGFITLLASLLGVTYRHGRTHGKLENQIKTLEDILERNRDTLEFANALRQLTKNQGIIDLAKSVGPEPPKRNPYDLNRKYALLQRYQAGTINLDEARELEAILQEDLKHAQDTNSAAVAAIVILLAALTAIVGMLGSRK